MTHRHLSEDELLDLLLARRAGGIGHCARCGAAAAELAAFLERCRASARRARRARPSSPALAALHRIPRIPRIIGGALPSDSRLVARILSRTTGEDLGWRGDLGLLAGFLRQRLSASRAVRLLAASLALHLLALPLCAWLALRSPAPERALLVRIEPREQALPEVPEEPVRALELPLLPEPEPVTPDPFAVQRRLERAQLEGRPLPAGPTAPTAPVDDRAAAALARLLALRAAGDPELVRRGPPELATPLERALWVEVLIDHFVLAGERLPDLEIELARVGIDSTAAAEVLWVEALVLERAAALGLIEAGDPTRLAALEGELARRLPEAVLGRPLGSRGFGQALAAALGGAAGGWAAWDR